MKANHHSRERRRNISKGVKRTWGIRVSVEKIFSNDGDSRLWSFGKLNLLIQTGLSGELRSI